MSLLQKFTTAGVAPGEKLRYWNVVADEVFTGTYVNADEPRFTGEMWHWGMGELNMIRTTSQRAAVGRRGIDRAEEHLIVHLQCRGTSRYRQGDYDAALEPGDFSIGSSHRPYSFDLSQHEMLVIEFPKAPLAERVRGLDDIVAGRICGASAAGRIFHDFLLSLWRQGGRLLQEDSWEPGMNSAFYDLAAAAIRGSDGGVGRHGHSLLRRATAFIEAELANPELRTTAIARELDLSVRSVQNLFANIGTTPMGFVLERRLNRAAERLMADPGASVTEIAFDHGFTDAGYFTRCFRQKHGASPRNWRLGQ
ncbi:MAG TPA: helix-turn-helix domain-containing protein [Sphingomonadaceae bacterium]|nr:helix-turn-helix domain-containing protein [Sphingomonadaceae bacterium]